MNKYLKFDDVKDLNSLKEYLRNIHELVCLCYDLEYECNLLFEVKEKDQECAGEAKENITGNKTSYNIYLYHLEYVDKVEILNLLNAYFHELNHILFTTKETKLNRHIIDTVETCIIQNDNEHYQEMHDRFLAEIEAIEVAQETVLDIVLKSNFQLDEQTYKFLLDEQLHVIDIEYYYNTYYLKNFVNTFNKIMQKDIEDKDEYLELLNIFYFQNGLPKSIEAIMNNKNFYFFYKNDKVLLYNFLASDYFINELKRENINEEARLLLNDVLEFDKKQEIRIDNLNKKFFKNEMIYNDYIDKALKEFKTTDKPKSYYIKKIKDLKNVPKTNINSIS